MVAVRARPLRVLDLDSECRPLSWISHDYVSKELTAIAWAWTDQPSEMTCYVLGETDLPTMLRAFLAAYSEADVVTGHYLRGHDLPLLNGALMEQQMPALGDKMTHDTKTDLIVRGGISASQENLSAMLRLEHNKVHMDQAKWREANRLTPEGREEARKRVTGDVAQHIELRQRLLALGYLGPMKKWRSNSSAPMATYIP